MGKTRSKTAGEEKEKTKATDEEQSCLLRLKISTQGKKRTKKVARSSFQGIKTQGLDGFQGGVLRSAGIKEKKVSIGGCENDGSQRETRSKDTSTINTTLWRVETEGEKTVELSQDGN